MGVWLACLGPLSYALLALLGLCVWLWADRARTHIPGPPTLPLLGNILYFGKLPVLVRHFRELHRRYGDVFRFYIGPKLFIVVTSPEDAKRLLVSVKMRGRGDIIAKTMIPFTGNGILINKGDTWKEHRRLIEPLFRSEIMKDFMGQFNDGAETVCRKLAAAGGTECDIKRFLLHASLRVVTSSIYSKNFDEIEPDVRKQAEVADVFMTALKLVQKRIFRPWLLVDWLFSILPDGQELKRQTSIVNASLQKGLDSLKNINTARGRTRRSFLDAMMDREGNFLLPEKEVVDEIRCLAIAGTESVANTLGNALALLGLHPEWQEAVWKEVDDVFREGGAYLRPCTENDVSQFKIMDAFIKETLRLYPVAPNAPVSIEGDIQLEGSGHIIPRGSLVLVSLILLHRRPENFPDPARFDPGRFLPGGSALSLPPGCYLPFGAGSRVCLGSRYAMLEIKTVLAAVLRRFRVLPGTSREELEQVEISISGTPVNGFRVTCIPRTNHSLYSVPHV